VVREQGGRTDIGRDRACPKQEYPRRSGKNSIQGHFIFSSFDPA
jgi:hypothetical protein